MANAGFNTVLRAGDRDGFGKVYSEGGGLIPRSDEEIVKTIEGWDMNVRSPWRRILPRIVFAGFRGKVSSRLYLTTKRIVLIRNIDAWREVKEELTPLGLPAAAAKEIHLKKLKAAGVRQFCEIWLRSFRVVRMRRFDRPRAGMDIRLLGQDGQQYGIRIWKTDGTDSETLSLLESLLTG